MNYRFQALMLGILLVASGAFVLIEAIIQYQTISSVEGSIIVFMGLGLVLIGSLIMFAVPQPLVASHIVSRALSPSAENLALILDSLSAKVRPIHVPQVELGGESQVLLLYSPKNLPRSNLAGHSAKLVPDWQDGRKVLEPPGIELMRGYERILRRDFFGLDTEQLGRLLSKAIVPEYELCSGFALRQPSPDVAEATWTKPIVLHTCTVQGSDGHPELCCLCSSVACALAKASGKYVWIERSESANPVLLVVTTFRVLGD